MKIILKGKHLDDVSHYFDNDGFEIVEQNPDLIIAHGGDGTLLGTERAFPGILKFPIRDERTAPLCSQHSYDQQIALFNEKKLNITHLPKLVGLADTFSVKGINDIFIHNLNRASAVRYQVLIDDELYANEVVGDGVGVSTIHGSTAYYRSITHSIFRTGIGLAFSNSTEVTNHLVLPESSKITIKIVRGPAIVIADNDNQEKYLMDVNDQITIHQTSELAAILGLDIFMCQACRNLRHSRKYRL